MPTVKEITIVFMAAFIDIATTTPTVAVKYTLYGTTKTWNEARAVCESQGQQMLKLDTKAKFDDFIAWKNIWDTNGLLASDIWTGLHQHVLTDPTVFTLEWHDCEPLGAWALWGNKEPNKPETEKCIRLHLSSERFRSIECSTECHVPCEESTGECTFERFDGEDVLLTSASSINASIDDCQRACLTYTGSTQCVAIVYDSETTSSDPCRIYTRQQVYINDKPEMTSTSGRTVLVKRCVQGDYKTTIVPVPPNTDDDPITACPVTTETSLLLTVTSSTSSNIVPEDSSIASSMTSTKASIIKTEAFPKSYLTSSMTSHKPTPISLYSLTSSSGFRDSTSLNFYWSLNHMTSIGDSTETSPVSTSNVAQSEFFSKVMTESSQMLLGVLDPTSSSTAAEPTSTTVSDPGEPESGIYFSSLDLDASSVAFSTVPQGSSSPSESHCVCECTNPQISMVFDADGNLLDRKNLSSYRRSKTSASDDRVSARAIGSSGLAIILLVTALIVCVDVDRVIRAAGQWRKRQAL